MTTTNKRDLRAEFRCVGDRQRFKRLFLLLHFKDEPVFGYHITQVVIMHFVNRSVEAFHHHGVDRDPQLFGLLRGGGRISALVIAPVSRHIDDSATRAGYVPSLQLLYRKSDCGSDSGIAVEVICRVAEPLLRPQRYLPLIV